MSNTATLDLATNPASSTRQIISGSLSASQMQAMLYLPPGEAFNSLLAVHELLTAQLPKGDLKVYEAGGGSTCVLPSSILQRADVTVVDIDAEQVRTNDYAQTVIHGDIQAYRFAPGSFDLVVCYNVVEHLPDVEAALAGFFQSLKPGGLVLIAAPNPNSLSGVVTKHSPHWFHVWYYRHIRGIARAGEPGQAPFPTFFHPLVAPSKLVAYGEKHGMELAYRNEHESPRYPEMRSRKPLIAAALDTVATCLNLFMNGGDVRRGDYHLILRKR